MQLDELDWRPNSTMTTDMLTAIIPNSGDRCWINHNPSTGLYEIFGADEKLYWKE